MTDGTPAPTTAPEQNAIAPESLVQTPIAPEDAQAAPEQNVTAIAAESDSEVEQPKEKLNNFYQETAFSRDLEWDDTFETLALPSAQRADSVKAIDKTPNISLTSSPAERKWADTFNEGSTMASYEDSYLGTVIRKTADFRQGLRPKGSEGVPLMAGSPKFRGSGEELTGDRGVLRLQDYIGMGTIFQVPLWHTGIWVTFKAPGESEILELQRLMIADKIQYGRRTYGAALASSTVFTAQRLMDFCIQHLYSTTLMGAQDLRPIISLQDLPAMVWGLACAQYPRGFQYRRACTFNPDKCTHVVEAKIDLSKLLWVDKNALTDHQVAHMSRRGQSNTISMEAVKMYKEAILETQNRTIVINSDTENPIRVVLKVPNIMEHIDSGTGWINDITNMVNEALGKDVGDQERNMYILRKGQATAMRQYMHWVESIEFGDHKMSDPETLAASFDRLSSDDHIREEFTKKVRTYIDDSAITVVGIPEYDCPICQGHNKGGTPEKLPKHVGVISLDPMQAFFELLAQKIARISMR